MIRIIASGLFFGLLVIFVNANFGNEPPLPWYFNSGAEIVFHGDTMVYEKYVGKQSIEFDIDFSCKSGDKLLHININ